jgi:hemerythrin
MPLLRWNPGYSVDDAELDNHHRRLFYLLNSAYENVMDSPQVDRILPIIDELTEYTRYHFFSEEQHMREKGFHGIDEHIEKHRVFAHTVEALRSRYHDNDLEVAKSLIIVLGEWLLGHVLKDDRRYSESSSGVKIRAESGL